VGAPAAQAACYERAVATDDDLQAIVEVGRRTRRPTPRWQWVAALLVGAVCVVGFAAGALTDPAPADHRAERRPVSGAGLGTGLVIGVAVGLALGVSLGRQRRDHSSRNRP